MLLFALQRLYRLPDTAPVVADRPQRQEKFRLEQGWERFRLEQAQEQFRMEQFALLKALIRRVWNLPQPAWALRSRPRQQHLPAAEELLRPLRNWRRGAE